MAFKKNKRRVVINPPPVTNCKLKPNLDATYEIALSDQKYNKEDNQNESGTAYINISATLL
jgi:NACalpha-BTF3-like transcription factor